MDPATIGLAITAASKAFGAIKAGFAAGREIESMGKDLRKRPLTLDVRGFRCG